MSNPSKGAQGTDAVEQYIDRVKRRPETEYRAAAISVCSRAESESDAKELLAMLGLLPSKGTERAGVDGFGKAKYREVFE